MPGSRPGRNPARIYRIVDYHTVLCAPFERWTPLVRYASQKQRMAHLDRDAARWQLYNEPPRPALLG